MSDSWAVTAQPNRRIEPSPSLKGSGRFAVSAKRERSWAAWVAVLVLGAVITPLALDLTTPG